MRELMLDGPACVDGELDERSQAQFLVEALWWPTIPWTDSATQRSLDRKGRRVPLVSRMDLGGYCKAVIRQASNGSAESEAARLCSIFRFVPVSIQIGE